MDFFLTSKVFCDVAGRRDCRGYAGILLSARFFRESRWHRGYFFQKYSSLTEIFEIFCQGLLFFIRFLRQKTARELFVCQGGDKR